MKQYRILAVDDNDKIISLYQEILMPKQNSQINDLASCLFDFAPSEPADRTIYTVETAKSGQEAIDMLSYHKDQTKTFDMVFMDIRMPPGMDGVETVTRLWAIDPGLHVAICTAFSDYLHEEISNRLPKADQLLIIKKPFDAIEISQAAAMLAAKRRSVTQQRYELKQARQDSQSALIARKTFLSIMGHELRTPMTGIIGFNDLLRTTKLTSRQKDLTGDVGVSARRLMSRIDDILEYSRLESAPISAEAQSDTLQNVIYQACDSIQKELKPTVDLLVEPNQVLLSHVRQSNRIEQVLTYLLNNAAKFTTKGSILITARPNNVNQSNQTVEISVSDTGIGIDEKDKEIILQPFTQADQGDDRHFGGMGLGLSIARRILKAIKSNLHVESSGKDSGARFFFSIEVDSPLTASKTPNRQEMKDGVTDRSILIADDNKLSARISEQMFEAIGMRVTTAHSTDEVIRWLTFKETHFDYILIDIDIPDHKGFIDLMRMLQCKELTHIKKIVLINHATSGSSKQLKGVTVTRLLNRPLRIDKVRNMINDIEANR